jgi:hypothetical protein
VVKLKSSTSGCRLCHLPKQCNLTSNRLKVAFDTRKRFDHKRQMFNVARGAEAGGDRGIEAMIAVDHAKFERIGRDIAKDATKKSRGKPELFCGVKLFRVGAMFVPNVLSEG